MKAWSFVVVIILIAIGAILVMSKHISNLNESLDIAINNNKAYQAENTSLTEDNVKFKFRIQDMQHMNDSITQKLLKTVDELNIKTKRLESLQYQKEHIAKTDTLYLRDTIFRDRDFLLDTCISDRWASTCLHLKYPNEIGVLSEFNNEKYIITSWKKEYVKQRKWFLPKLFTRKQKIVTIDVVDENPYVTTERQRFIEIIE